MVDQIITVEKLGMVGILLYVIHMLIKAMPLSRKSSDKVQKAESRDKIASTNAAILDVRSRQREQSPIIYGLQRKTDDIHDIVTAKGSSGAPMIYNPELHNSMSELNNSTKNLTEAINRLTQQHRRG